MDEPSTEESTLQAASQELVTSCLNLYNGRRETIMDTTNTTQKLQKDSTEKK